MSGYQALGNKILDRFKKYPKLEYDMFNRITNFIVY